MAIRNRLTQTLGIEHPGLLAPMDAVSGGRLAAAVSRAGGLGLIGGGYGDHSRIGREWREAGNARVGCGLITWSLARRPGLLDGVLARKPAAVMLSFGDPRPFAGAVRAAGARWLGRVWPGRRNGVSPVAEPKQGAIMQQSGCRRWSSVELLLSVFLVCLLCSFMASAQQPREQHKAEFWLGAPDPVVQRDRKINNPSDYMEIFQPPERWRSVSSRTSTLEISTQLVLRGTSGEHQALIDGLRRNHLMVAGQFGVEEYSTDPACGGAMEGQGGPANAAGVAKRVHDLGIPLDYLDMDEPVTWGRMSPRNKCPKSVEQLAQTATSKVAAYRQQFPGIKVNLIDAVGGSFKTAVHDEIEFVDLLGNAGVHIDYFIADVQWSGNWRPGFEDLATKLHARGIKVGMYCDGLISSNTDLAWDRDAVNNCKAAGEDRQIAPDLFMIGTWSPYPTKIFPEDKPGTLTHISKELMSMFP